MLRLAEEEKDLPDFTAAELGAVAHLYRGEIYRSTAWRSRLDNTTNWSIVTMGIALSTTFSSRDATALPLILIGLLLAIFLGVETRRYQYYTVWTARSRYMETHLFVPILKGERQDSRWRRVLADEYLHPNHYVTFFAAAGRRVRRTYIWIIGIQTFAYFGKIAVHPQMASHFSEFADRATIGPIPGTVVLACGLLYNTIWICLAIASYLYDERLHHKDALNNDPVLFSSLRGRSFRGE